MREVLGRVPNKNRTQAHMARDLLEDLLVSLYGEPDCHALLRERVSMPFLLRYGESLQRVIRDHRRWTRKTAHLVLSVLRSMLREHVRVPAALVRATRLAAPSSSRHPIFGKKFANLSMEVRARLETWLQVVKDTTRTRSTVSLRNWMTFLTGPVLRHLGLALDTWPVNAAELAGLKCQEETVVRAVCGKGKKAPEKLRTLQHFLAHVLQSPLQVPVALALRLARERNVDEEDDGCDHHRISKDELEKLHVIAQKDPLNELFFLTLLTTGMRIGGFVRMKCQHVADLRERWVAREEGKTLEKGNKAFAFKIHPRVRELLTNWLNKDRVLSPSEYVFPGREGGHVSTQAFRSRLTHMCRTAELRGTHLHPHAFRHSFSHILLEVGNSADVVSKLLNHTNVATTQKYYLKETAAQVAQRAIIPWAPEKTAVPSPVPSFLACTRTASSSLTATITALLEGA